MARQRKQVYKLEKAIERYCVTCEDMTTGTFLFEERIGKLRDRLIATRQEHAKLQEERRGMELPPFDPKFLRRHVKDFEDAIDSADLSLRRSRLEKFVVELTVFRKDRIDAVFRLPLPRPPKRTVSRVAAGHEFRRPEVQLKCEYSVNDKLQQPEQTLRVLVGWRSHPDLHQVGTVVRKLDQHPPVMAFLNQCRKRSRRRLSVTRPSTSGHVTPQGGDHGEHS
jgi:hypothetical protein